MIYYITGKCYNDPDLTIGHGVTLGVNESLTNDFAMLSNIFPNITVKQEFFSVSTLEKLESLGKVTVLKSHLN